MKKLILCLVLLSGAFLSWPKPANAQTANCNGGGSIGQQCNVTYSGLQLQTFWQSDSESDCPGVFVQITGNLSGFFPPGYVNPAWYTLPYFSGVNPYENGGWFTDPLNCSGGSNTGIGIENAQNLNIPSGAVITSAVVTYFTPLASAGNQQVNLVLGITAPSNVRLFLPGPFEARGALSLVQYQVPVLSSITLWYNVEPTLTPTDTIVPGVTPTETPTPLASITSIDFPTIPVVTVPIASPSLIATMASGPLSTIPPPTNVCSGDPFSPCGTLPYQLVFLPTLSLNSPTAIPTLPTYTPIPLTATPVPTATPTLPGTITNTPVNTPIATIGFGDSFDFLATALNSQFSTLAPLASSGDWTVNGTPVGIVSIANQLGGNAGQAIGFLTAIQGFQLGTAGNLLTIAFFILLIVLIIEILTLILPILLALIRFILRAVTALKPF